MKVIKKFTAIQIESCNGKNYQRDIELSYGTIEGTSYSREYPEEEFDTEEEAIEYAYKKSKYSKWLIVPIIKFD